MKVLIYKRKFESTPIKLVSSVEFPNTNEGLKLAQDYIKSVNCDYSCINK